MQISKNIQLNYQNKGQNVYKSDKYIYRQKYNLHISVHRINLQTCLLPPCGPLIKK